MNGFCWFNKMSNKTTAIAMLTDNIAEQQKNHRHKKTMIFCLNYI